MKLIMILVMTLGILMGSTPASVHAADAVKEKPIHVLLTYDSYGIGTPRQGSIDALQQLLAAYGVQVTIADIDSYQVGTLQTYEKVIGVHNAYDLPLTNADYIADLAAYKGDYLHIGAMIPAQVEAKLGLRTQMARGGTIRLSVGKLQQTFIQAEPLPYAEQSAGRTYGELALAGKTYPFAVSHERYAYIPYLKQGNLSEIAAAYVLKDWLEVNRKGRTYLLFKEVYPFSDLQLLERLADQLHEAGLPFMVSVRPVFSNTDYPAMKRYLETLKYIQSRNGSIIVNAPVVASTISVQDDTLQAKMESFIDVLADYGIAPLGVGAEMYWSYDHLYAEQGMSFSDSAVLYPNEQASYRSRADTSKAFQSSLFSMPLSFMDQFERSSRAIPSLPMDSVITYDFFKDREQLDNAIQSLLDSWITFADYKYESHAVRTPRNEIISYKGTIAINGQSVDLGSAIKDISSDYTYKEEQQKSFEKLFNVQNKVFIIIIIVTLMVFGGFFIVGYRLYKRKYYK
ncbi:hypothetical protein MH117_12550 [Paenibacillus sp. ACRRX]|uniref:hypothetical protein n=1 Tax=unclassified Paenibacillus TaxID=185978 RepID=UPI001EF69B21|nr:MULTISPECIES: hypothetical protein [unclassified Paenibacillus]MCG7408254.1 hypothetical protein [Paenibacillus sp. ACRRX]MDK8181361.1 hypothetical protein [Paenibacillus sp. UMB4589-SE434]